MKIKEFWRYIVVKSELISAVSRKVVTLSQKDVETSVNHILDVMTGALSNGERLEIRGFGSFSLNYQPPRDAWNPKTKEKVATIAKYRPHFRAGKELRERVNANFGKPLPGIDSSEAQVETEDFADQDA
jgi:integration host factor subunit beta